MINIKGIDKAEVLAALYNASKQQGMGFLHDRGYTGMTVDDAQAELTARLDSYRETSLCKWRTDEVLIEMGAYSFDYLHGRVMKVDIGGDEFHARGYDRDNGQGAALRALSPLGATEVDDHEQP